MNSSYELGHYFLLGEIDFIRKSCLSGASQCDDAKAEANPESETRRDKVGVSVPLGLNTPGAIIPAHAVGFQEMRGVIQRAKPSVTI